MGDDEAAAWPRLAVSAGDAVHTRKGKTPLVAVEAQQDTAVGVQRPLHPVTMRALVLGLVLVVAFTVAGCFSVFLRYEIIGTGYLPRGAIALLLGLVLANTLVGRMSRRLHLQPHEMLLAFVMLMTIGAIPGQEFAQHQYLNTLGLTYYARPPTARPDLYLEDFPRFLLPSSDPESAVITDAYDGLPGGKPVPWGAWLKPLAIWTPFFFAVYWLVLCFSAVLSPHWENNERLLFPLTQVPVEMARPENGALSALLKSKLMWACFALACVPYVFKGLHQYYPTVPDINLQRNAGPLFGSGPLAVFDYLMLHIYPEMIGIAYLLTAEVGFSMWFFYLFGLGQQSLREAMGRTQFHAEFFEFQTVGGYLVLAIAVLFSARHHLRGVIHHAFGGRPPADQREPQPYRIAVLGFIAGFAFICWWCWRVGMTWYWAALLYTIFPLGSMIVARVICEAGMFIYSTPFRMNETVFRIAGTRTLGPQNIALLTAVSWTQIRSTATLNMPAVFQSLQIGSQSHLRRPQVFWGIFLATCLAILVSHVTSLYVIYTWGVRKLGWWPRGSSQGTVNGLVRFLTTPTEMTAGNWGALALGAGTTVFLVIMRTRFLWWPFHPLGYVAWLGWPIQRYWLSFLIGWLTKVVVVRVTGFKGFRALRPAAFGLILGICFILTFWLVFHFFYPTEPLVIE